MSWGVAATVWPSIGARPKAAIIDRMPPISTMGRLSSTWPQRKDTENTANPAAEMRAAMLPSIRPPSMPPPIITKMPAPARPIATQVVSGTRSPNAAQPRMAAKKGAAE